MDTIITIIVFCLVLGFLVGIHEFGHFMVAKHFGVYCPQFSIGMGPKLISKKIGETEYELSLLPIGGFVTMAGETDQEDNEELKDVPLERTIKGLSCWKKVAVFSAGVIMNFISSFIIVVLVYFISVPVSSNSSTLGTIVEDSPAYEAGLMVSDTINQISTVDGEHTFLIGSFDELTTALNKEANGYEGDTMTFIVSVTRNNEYIDIYVEATYNESTGNYYLGVSPTTRRLSLSESISYGFDYCKESCLLIFETLGNLVTDSANTIDQLSGPVGIYQATSEITSTGQISYVFLFAAMLGLNLGVFNLLPIPGLDGAQILIAVCERIIGREIPSKIKLVLQLAGLALVFGLMIVVTFNDVLRLF